ncbi:hypothetical protein GCM10010433_62250 [Streptomyces pulveraceus]
MHAQVDTGSGAGAGGHVPVVGVQHVRVDPDPRETRGKVVGPCPMGGRPASVEQPACASAKDPVQMLTTRAPRECAWRSARTTGGEGGSSVVGQPGTITVSARSSASSPSVTSMSYPACVATGPGCSVHTPKASRVGSPCPFDPELLGRAAEFKGRLGWMDERHYSMHGRKVP